MRAPLRLATLIFFVSLTHLAACDAGESPAVAAGEIKVWAEQLSSDEYQIRDEAHRKLVDAGQPALPVLERILQTSIDAEARERAERIINKITTGPRIRKAAEDLGSPDFNVVQKACEVLLAELEKDPRAQEALKDAANGTDLAAQTAKEIVKHLEEVERRTVGLRNAIKNNQQRPEIVTAWKRHIKSVEEQMRKELYNNLKKSLDAQAEKNAAKPSPKK